MRCEELMKKDVVSVRETDTVQTAACKLRDENVGFLPVCDDAKRVLGTLTDRDIAIRLCATDRPASQTKIGDVMTREVVACRPTDDLRRAEELMGQQHKSRILITDDQKRLIGVISLSDIATCEGHEQAANTMRAVSAREARPRANARA